MAAATDGQAAGPPIRLQEGERVILDMCPSKLWTGPLYVATLDLWELWRRCHRFLLTNQRVTVTKGIVNKPEKSAPLDRVQDARLARSVFSGGRVYITTPGPQGPAFRIGDPGVPLTWADAVAFADSLTPLIRTQGRTP